MVHIIAATQQRAKRPREDDDTTSTNHLCEIYESLLQYARTNYQVHSGFICNPLLSVMLEYMKKPQSSILSRTAVKIFLNNLVDRINHLEGSYQTVSEMNATLTSSSSSSMSTSVALKRITRLCRLAVSDLLNLLHWNVSSLSPAIQTAVNDKISWMSDLLQDSLICLLKKHILKGISTAKKINQIRSRQPPLLPLGLVAGPQYEGGRLVFKHGNFNTYYALRRAALDRICSTSSGGIDARLVALRDQLGGTLFKEKSVLDIGCNAGVVSFTVAGVLGAKSVVSVDIDLELINKCLDLLRAAKKQFLFKHLPAYNDDNVSDNSLDILRHALPPFPSSYAEVDSVLKAAVEQEIYSVAPFPFNIEFRSMDILRCTSLEQSGASQFDTILALSVTKWIHLNTGDVGLMKCFAKMYRLLKPGGHFVLEPQSWESYRKMRRTRSEFKAQIKKIQLKPHQFDEYLRNNVGFKLVSIINVHHNNDVGEASAPAEEAANVTSHVAPTGPTHMAEKTATCVARKYKDESAKIHANVATIRSSATAIDTVKPFSFASSSLSVLSLANNDTKTDAPKKYYWEDPQNRDVLKRIRQLSDKETTRLCSLQAGPLKVLKSGVQVRSLNRRSGQRQPSVARAFLIAQLGVSYDPDDPSEDSVLSSYVPTRPKKPRVSRVVARRSIRGGR